jgi:hypothetical protein
MKSALDKLNRLLVVEEDLALKLNQTRAARNLQDARNDLLEHIREIARRDDLSLIIATERAIVGGDLSHYANSQSMIRSLKTALSEIAAIEQHIEIVDDPDKYPVVDQAHSLPKNRKNGLPFDEARQALASHGTRLDNLDKSRLDDNEKMIVKARKSNILQADRLYAERQAKTLGVEVK